MFVYQRVQSKQHGDVRGSNQKQWALLMQGIYEELQLDTERDMIKKQWIHSAKLGDISPELQLELLGPHLDFGKLQQQ